MGQRIRSGRTAHALSQQALADLVGVQRATISQWETDRERPGRDKVVALAHALALSLDVLLSQAEGAAKPGNGATAAPSAAAGAEDAVARNAAARDAVVRDAGLPARNFALADIAVPHFRSMPQTVPVLGNASAGTGDQYQFNGAVADYVRRSPGIASASQVFAAYVVGESMYPAFRDGQLFFVHPGRRARVGDDVLVELLATEHDAGPSFLKRMVRLTPTQLVVEQFNPPRQLTFEKTTVRSLFKVLTLDELVGV